MDKQDAKWNEETQSGTYSDKIHWGEMKVKPKEMDKQEIIEGNKIIAGFDSRLMLDESDPKKETWDLVDPKDGGWLHVSHLKYHEDWSQLIPVWTKFWNEANEFCFGAAKAKQYEDLRNIRVIFMACIDNGDIANASRIMADSIKWLNSQKQ